MPGILGILIIDKGAGTGMRIRRKPWARPELEACPFYFSDARSLRNRWETQFPHPGPLHVELGCGKGGFLAQLSQDNPQVNYLGLDIKSEVLVLAKRAVEAQLGTPHPANVRLAAQDIERIYEILGPQDPVERIYINFCNPWSKHQQQKKRLTHPRQLLKYRTFLKEAGEIWFKTDSEELFEESLSYFEETGFALRFVTRDLHGCGFSPNILTEHERMYAQKGLPIHFLIAVKLPDTAIHPSVLAEQLAELEYMKARLTEVETAPGNA